MTWVRSLASARGALLLAAAFFVQTTSGCLSNEYRISKDELQRLAQLPPEQRGERVHVSQDLGERRSDAVDPPEAPPPSGTRAGIEIDVSAGGSGDGGGAHASGSGSWHGTPPSSTWHGAPPSSGWHGAPASSGGGGTHVSGGFHGTAVGSGQGGGSGGWHASSGGGGGSGGSVGDSLGALVVALLIGAAIATVVLAGSEGMRFAGEAQTSPDQPIHVQRAGGGSYEIPLGALTLEEAAAAESATVMDDEGWGLRRLAHGPIERKGPTFRFELGGGAFTFAGARASGLASHVQVGGYLTPTFGLVLDLAFSSGDVDFSCCVGPVVGSSLSRDSLGLQAELTPFGIGPLHLGAFAGGGVAIAGSAGAHEQGPMGTAGARLELEMTAHMALTVRAGASTAYLPTGWSSAGSVTGGLAIY